MTLYGKYILERTGHLICENERGFATYKYLDDNKTVYIMDIYVLPEFRHLNVATKIADEIYDMAKHSGANKMLGSVVPSAKGSTESIQVLIHYGMRVVSSAQDFILFSKDIYTGQ